MNDQPENQTQAAPRKTGRGVKIALGLSLALNLLIVGVVAGAVWGKIGGSPGNGGPMTLRTLGLGPMVFVLDREDRDALRDRLRAEERTFQPVMRGLGGAMGDFAEALRAAPFDREAAAAALAQSRVQIEAVQSHGHEVLLDHLEMMAPEARGELADRLERRLRHGRGGERGGSRG